MASDDKTTGKARSGGTGTDRQERLSAALRANLRRRKAQARSRRAADADDGSTNESGAGSVETPRE